MAAVRDIASEYGIFLLMVSKDEVLNFVSKLRTDKEFRELMVRRIRSNHNYIFHLFLNYIWQDSYTFTIII